MRIFYFACTLAFLLLFSVPFSSSESKVQFLQDVELQENNSEKEGNFIIDNTDLKTSKYIGNEFLASGEFPKGYTGKALVLTSIPTSPGSSYLPPLRVGNSFLHFSDRSTTETYLSMLENPDVLQVNFDRKLDFLTEAQQEPQQKPQQAFENVSYLDRFQDVSRSQEVHDTYGITGENVKIGITDSGIDFGNSAISSSLFQLPSGYSASFDPSGSGFAVAPITLNSITVGSITSLPLRGRTFDVWGAEQQTFLTSTQLGINLRDLDITLLSRPSLTNQYKVGIAYEPLYRSSETYTNIFVFVLSDFAVPGIYDTLYVDLSTSLGLTLASNNLIFESGALYQRLVDWSLVDETPYGSFNPIIARDLTGDGINDISMGALATTLVPTSQLAEGILTGIDPEGRGIAYFYDSYAHGTYTAGTIASQGKIRFPVYDNVTTSEIENGTLTTITGTAPGVKIIGTKGLTGNNALIGWLWSSGLEPVILTNTWKVVRDHVVQISSNSWGIGGAHESTIKGASTEALFIDALSSPDVFNYLGPQLGVLSYDDFQGISFVVSSGNGGPGIGTVGNPASASLAFTIGASTSFHTLMGTAQNDVALFSSRGPSAYGYMKPDVVALGSFGFIPGPVALGFGNGTYAVDSFSGTSEAAPTAAGVMALVYEAMQRKGIQPDIGKLRTVLKSTARDLGFSGAAQGAGLVDAFESVSAILDGEHIIVQDHLGSQKLSERVNPAFLNLFGQDHPNSGGKFPDSTIHLTTSTLNLGHTLEFSYGNGTKVKNYTSIVSAFSKLSFQDSKTITRKSSDSIPNLLELNTTIDLNVTLIQVITSLTENSYRQLLTNNLQPPRLTLVELSQNEVIAQAFTTAYSTTLDVGFPADNFGAGIALQLTDPGYENQISGWNGLTYQITLRTYSHEKWNGLTGNFSNDAYSITQQNLVEEYQFGQMNFLTSKKITRVPIVYAYLENPEAINEPGILGDELPATDFYRVNQVLATWNWFDPTASAESGDHRHIQLLTPENATHIGISVTWNNQETLPLLFLYNSEGTLVTTSDYAYQGLGYYTGNPTNATAQLLYAATTSGIYYLEIHTIQTPFISSPTNLSINVLYVNLLGIPAPAPSFSQDLTEKISGELTIDASSYLPENFPSLKIAKTDVTVFTSQARTYQGTLKGINLIRGELTPEEDPIEVYFEKGEKVTLSLNWSTISASRPDLDIYIISKGSGLNLKQDVLAGQGTTPASLPEAVQFGINESGLYEIYIDYISDFNGFTVLDIDYTLALDSRIGPLFTESSPVITIPTDSFADLTYGLKIQYTTNYGISFELYRTELDFENHDPFTSSITKLTTSEGEVNLEWSASREVRATLQLHTMNFSFLLINNHLQTSFTFNSNGYSVGDAVLSLILSDGFYSVTHNQTLTISNQQTLGPYIIDATGTQIGLQYGMIVVIAFSLLYYFLRKVKKSKLQMK